MGNPSEITGGVVDESHIQLRVGDDPCRCRRRSKIRKAAGIVFTFGILWLLLKSVQPHCTRRVTNYDLEPEPEFLSVMDKPHDGVKILCSDPSNSTVIDTFEGPNGHKDWKSATASYKLPSNAPTLFVAARGRSTAGEITFEENEDLSSTDIFVNIEVRYRHENLAKLCEVEFDTGAKGIAVVTPRGHPHQGGKRHLHHVSINVVFPTSSSPLRIRSFKTWLPLFKHKIDLTEAVELESFSVATSEAPIEVKGVTAASAKFKARNAPIMGHFNATNLTIVTTNAPIHVQVNLKSRDKDTPGTLVLETKNADIKGRLSLFSFEGDGGEFDIDAKTANGPLSLEFPTAPTSSLLRLGGYTANAPVQVTLHPSYEGTFDVSTSIFATTVYGEPAPEDPSGDDRKRTVQFEHLARSAAQGKVFWGEESDKTPDGVVKLETSISPLTLKLGVE